MDFHFRAFCISQYIKERTISLYMSFVKFFKSPEKFYQGFFLCINFLQISPASSCRACCKKPDTEK